MRSMQLVALITVVMPVSGYGAEAVRDRAVSSQTAQVRQLPGAQTLSTPTIEQQLAALQKQVQTLQAQLAMLQSVLKVTPAGATLEAPTLSLLSTDGTTIQSQKAIALAAGTGLSVQSQAGATISSSSSLSVNVSGTLDLRAATTRLNGGGRPVATVGSVVVDGQVVNGSATVLAP